MEVTEIILTKVSRLCQLSSNSRGFLSIGYRFLNPQGLVVVFFLGNRFLNPQGLAYGSLTCKAPSYDTTMLLKVRFFEG